MNSAPHWKDASKRLAAALHSRPVLALDRPLAGRQLNSAGHL